MNKLMVSIFFGFVIFACSEKSQTKTNKIIDFESNITNFNYFRLSQITNNIQYIPLESNDFNLIDDINSIDFSSKYIFVNDYDKCLLFNFEGKFLKQIGKKGKGPGEYIRPSIVRISRSNEILFIPDGKKILAYNVNGDYLFSIKNPDQISRSPLNKSWIPVNDSVFVSHIRNRNGNNKHKLLYFNKESDTLKLIKNSDIFQREQKRSSSDDGKANLYYFNDLLSYKELFNDTLFRLTSNFKLEIGYIFKLGKFKFPTHYRVLPLREYYKKYKDYIWIHNIIETENFIFLNCIFNNHYPLDTYKLYLINNKLRRGQAPILGIYNKNEDNMFFVMPQNSNDIDNPNGIENDIDGGMNFFPMEKINDSTLIMWINSFELKNYTNSEAFKNSTPKYPEKKKELEQLANSLDENDNPVLMLVKLKE